MQGNQERLEFSVRLAQQEIRDADLPKLRNQLEAFLEVDHQVGGISATAELSDKCPLPEDYSIADFEALGRDARAVFTDIVKGKTAKLHSPEYFDVQISLSAAPIAKRKYRSVLSAYGSTQDAFLFKLFLLLGNENADKILQCAAPDCENIFFKSRGQECCSSRCTRRVYMRGYREADESYREKEKENAHKRYKKNVLTLYGRRRKVARRPRKRG